MKISFFLLPNSRTSILCKFKPLSWLVSPGKNKVGVEILKGGNRGTSSCTLSIDESGILMAIRLLGTGGNWMKLTISKSQSHVSLDIFLVVCWVALHWHAHYRQFQLSFALPQRPCLLSAPFYQFKVFSYLQRPKASMLCKLRYIYLSFWLSFYHKSVTYRGPQLSALKKWRLNYIFS